MEICDCDVLIVGAGPAGSATAFWLASAGADVVLLDKAMFPRIKPCGDGLTPLALRELSAMGIDHTLVAQGRPFAGLRISVEDSYSTIFDLPPQADGTRPTGLVLSRLHFDTQLFKHAQAAGAHTAEGADHVRPHRRGDQWHFTCEHGHVSREFRPRLTILATGANRTLLYRMGLVDELPPSGLALRGYLDGLPARDSYLDIFLDRQLLTGYAWSFPAGPTQANVGAGIGLYNLDTIEASRRLRQIFGRLLENPLHAGGRLREPPQGYPILADYPSVPVHGDGVLVVGESAGLVDPLTGEGIAYALESGRMAAAAALDAFRSGQMLEGALAAYPHALEQRFGTYFADARELLARLGHPQVIAYLIDNAQTDRQVSHAMQRAIVDGNPREGICELERVLAGQNALAEVSFAVQAYLPLLARCRSFLLAQVKRDAPTPALLALLRRGKMLRALLVFLGCEAANGDLERVLAAAAGIELVHAASLIHDDIMDEADTRRDQPALHIQHGIPRAIVGGDYLLAKSFELLAQSRAANPAANVVEAFLVGAQSGIRTCAGQWQDVGRWTDEMLTEDAYLRVVHDKTAAPITGALQAGAVLAGAPPALVQQLAEYGSLVGQAFQLRDDVLDWQAMLAGKPMDRRPTLPLVHAFGRSEPDERTIVRMFLNGSPVDAIQLRNIVESGNSIDYTAGVARSRVDRAIEVAGTVPYVQKILQALARYVLLRTS